MASPTEPTRITESAWLQEVTRRFGPDSRAWRFCCPSCDHIASIQDWKDAGASEADFAFSCVGRHLPNPKRLFDKPGPCDYAGGGLFKLNPVTVVRENGAEISLFAFAPAPEVSS